MEKTIHQIVCNWKLLKWHFFGGLANEATRVASNENLSMLARTIYSTQSIRFTEKERKAAKDYLLYNPDMSERFQRRMEEIIRDSGL